MEEALGAMIRGLGRTWDINLKTCGKKLNLLSLDSRCGAARVRLRVEDYLNKYNSTVKQVFIACLLCSLTLSNHFLSVNFATFTRLRSLVWVYLPFLCFTHTRDACLSSWDALSQGHIAPLGSQIALSLNNHLHHSPFNLLLRSPLPRFYVLLVQAHLPGHSGSTK